jgi:hypothetical protein
MLNSGRSSDFHCTASSEDAAFARKVSLSTFSENFCKSLELCRTANRQKLELATLVLPATASFAWNEHESEFQYVSR